MGRTKVQILGRIPKFIGGSMNIDGVYFEDEARLAKYIVELTKLGAAYVVERFNGGWMVRVTGF
jgi:hypothetical protein